MDEINKGRPRGGTGGAHDKLFSRDLNYLRDLALVWPFALSLLLAPASLLSPSHRQIGLTVALLGIGSFLLMREKVLWFFGALGFLALQGVLDLIVGHRSWPVVGVTVLTGVPFLIANRHWRRSKPSYELPDEVGVVDVLLSFASICVFILLFLLIGRLVMKLFPHL